MKKLDEAGKIKENNKEAIFFPGCDKKRLLLPGGLLLGASARGRMHQERDDAFLFSSVKDIAVIAVSDGAASKPFSPYGARAACVGNVVFSYSRFLVKSSFIRDKGGRK